MNLEFLFEYNIYYPTFRQWYVFFFWPHRRGGGGGKNMAKYYVGEIKWLKGKKKVGVMYIFPLICFTHTKFQKIRGYMGK